MAVYWGTDPIVWFGDPVTWGASAAPIFSGSADFDTGPIWTWVVGDGASATTPQQSRQLTAATGRVITWRVAGHAYAQFSIDGTHDEAAEITERQTDLWAYRNGELVFRGRIVSSSDELDGTKHLCQFNAVDYRGMLMLAAVVEPPVPTWTSTPQGQIAWELIEDWQALDGGDYGITDALGTGASNNRDETDITPGTPVAEVIDRLADRDGGFEWEISPELELNRWYPARGSDNGVVLDYGGLIAQVSVQTDTFGNAAIATGDGETTTTSTAEDVGVATDQRGRWTVSESYPSVTLQSTLDAKAQWLVDQAFTNGPSWSVTFAPNRWGGTSDVWIGDTVVLQVASGRLQVADQQRVAELQVVVGDNGGETVRAGLVGV